MRTNQARKTGSALLDRPEQSRPSKRIEEIRRIPSEPFTPRRESTGARPIRSAGDDESFARPLRRGRIRGGLIPQSRYGRIAALSAVAAILAGAVTAAIAVRRFLHHDPRFTIQSSRSIELRGNAHLSRAQLLSVFGEDVDRNIFDISLAERRAELEQMPWVQHATVMRLLPDRLRVEVLERTPVAFVREGSTIGMADASGVLLDIPPDAPGNPSYSFPVITGLKPDDTPALRQERMHLYTTLLHDLDSGGKKISTELSEVDLSDPEDAKVLLPSGNAETLVHFGAEDFLARYKRFQENIADWREQYPRLSSVDLRYDRQVVLQMPPRDSTVPNAPPAAAAPTVAAASHSPAIKPAAASQAKAAPAAKPVTAAAQIATLKLKPQPPPAAAPRQLPSLSASLPTPSTVPVKPVVIPPSSPAAAAKQPTASLTAAAKKTAPLSAAKQAEMNRRVEAIRLWMAKRQKMRDAAKAKDQ